MVTISAGSGTSGMGGAQLAVGPQHGAHGRSVSVESGEGTSTSSGVIAVRSANSGAAGVSGRLVFSSGSAEAGNSGALYLGSGVATAAGAAW